jgi:hypothetical protein
LKKSAPRGRLRANEPVALDLHALVIPGVHIIPPKVTLQYIPRSFLIQPRVRVTIFRDCGSAVLDIGCAAIAEICEPKSDGPEDLLQAFRESIPTLLRILSKTIANTPPGGVVFVTAEILRANKIDEA